MSGGRRKVDTTGSAGAIAFTALLLAVTLVALASTRGLQASSAIVPRVVGVPLAALLGYRLIREIVHRRKRGEAGRGEGVAAGADAIRAVFWVLALPAISTLLGFVAGPALYVFSFARFRAGERVAFAIAAGAGTAAAILLLFGWLLGAALPHGLVAALV